MEERLAVRATDTVVLRLCLFSLVSQSCQDGGMGDYWSNSLHSSTKQMLSYALSQPDVLFIVRYLKFYVIREPFRRIYCTYKKIVVAKSCFLLVQL